MRTFDRYLLAQLVRLFGFFSLLLVAIYWVNQAVGLFDRLIGSGQAGAVFLELTVLTLPNVIRLVLPVSAFAAGVQVANRMRAERELVVAHSSGISPLRLARPVALFGLLGASVALALTLAVGPLAKARLDERSAEIAEDVTSGLLTDGEFLHPAPGLTVYIREITPETELLGVFLSDDREPGVETTYTAERALLVPTAQGPRLLMFDGLVQDLTAATGRLSTTRFDDFAFDISGLIDLTARGPRDIDAVPTAELWAAGPELADELGASGAELWLALHMRVEQGAQVLAAAVLGFSVMMLGGFSRFGTWRQVGGAALALIVLELSRNLASDAARTDPRMWALVYLPPAAGLAVSGACLWLAGRSHRRPRARGMAGAAA
ncbi:LptF/LptG family permease [Palleronia sediminis]|uniref:LptF/LptG family permease n=1 Tax=Palleronia sediminis TaxID=2547833 RepID=A0A4R6AE57_9RHOB|nr:LptF/LptG family permease [Palleronia sediminis]TDL79493.1 LptF/LptG family permease [Palleronia sediminis]